MKQRWNREREKCSCVKRERITMSLVRHYMEIPLVALLHALGIQLTLICMWHTIKNRQKYSFLCLCAQCNRFWRRFVVQFYHIFKFIFCYIVDIVLKSVHFLVVDTFWIIKRFEKLIRRTLSHLMRLAITNWRSLPFSVQLNSVGRTQDVNYISVHTMNAPTRALNVLIFCLRTTTTESQKKNEIKKKSFLSMRSSSFVRWDFFSVHLHCHLYRCF